MSRHCRAWIERVGAVWLVLTIGGFAAAAEDPPPPPVPTCDRDVEADLLTIEDRLLKGRVDAARAYTEDLLGCPEGRTEPRVHLAMAIIEERIGALNEAAEALARAEALAAADSPHREAILAAAGAFRARWVAVEIAVDTTVSSPDTVEYAGLVMDATTGACLADLEDALARASGLEQPRTWWLVPGLYRVAGEAVELAAGDHATLRIPGPTRDEGGGS